MYCTNYNFIKNKWLYFCIGGKNVAANLDPLYLCPDWPGSDCNSIETGAAASTPVLVCKREGYNQAQLIFENTG